MLEGEVPSPRGPTVRLPELASEACSPRTGPMAHPPWVPLPPPHSPPVDPGRPSEREQRGGSGLQVTGNSDVLGTEDC